MRKAKGLTLVHPILTRILKKSNYGSGGRKEVMVKKFEKHIIPSLGAA